MRALNSLGLTVFATTLAMACTSPSGPGGAVPDSPVMTIEPGSATLPGGSSMKFTATIKDEHGLTTFPVDVSWLSSNQSVAAARAGGVVQGISAGQTQIIATWRNARATARVTVTGRSSKKPDLPACPRVEASGRSLVIPTDGAEC